MNREWEKDECHAVKLSRLIGYTTMLHGNVGLGLMIQMARSKAEVRQGGTAVQLVLTSRDARELAAALLKTADAFDADFSPHGQLH